MSQSEAQERVRLLAKEAARHKSLNIVFGSNGLSGRNATGNFSLLAKAIGMSRVHIGRILKGDSEPSYKTLTQIENVTGISVSDIIDYIRDQVEKKAA